MCLDYVRNSWKIYSKNYFNFIAGAAMSTIVTAIGFMIASFAMTGSFFDIFSDEMLPMTMQTTNIAIGVFIMAVTIVANIIIMAGIYGMAAESIRKKTSIDTMIRTIKSKGILVLATSVIVMFVAIASAIPMISIIVFFTESTSILEVVLLSVSLLFFLLVMSFFSLVYPSAIENKKVMDVLRSSAMTVKNSYIGAISLILFFGIISAILGAIPFVGVILTTFIISPCSYIAITMFYQKNKKK